MLTGGSQHILTGALLAVAVPFTGPWRKQMDTLDGVRRDIERLAGIDDSDSEMFWALSRRCTALALAPSIAAGLKWGPGLVAAGSVVLPGIGTISGTTAALLLMGGAWAASYGACMSLLPQLIKFRDDLRTDPRAQQAVRQDLLLIRRRAA